MAGLDTNDELRNYHGVGDDLSTVALLPDGVLDQGDLENFANFYFGHDYDPTPEAPIAEFGFTVDPQHVRGSFFDQSTGGQPTSWAWDFGDPESGTANNSALENPIHEFSGYGVFTVRLTVSNAVGSDTVEHQVTIEDPGMPYVPINHHQEQGRARLIEQFRVRGPV